MLITQENLDALRKTFSMIFENAYTETETYWQNMATEVPSQNGENIYGWIAQQLKAREWDGPRIAQNLEEREYLLPNKEFESTVELKRTKLEDDSLGLFSGQTVPQVGRSIAKVPDTLIADIMLNNTTCFDGGDFFRTDHPTFAPDGSTYSNLIANNDLNLANFATTWGAMASYVGEDRLPLGINPNLLIVPPQLKRQALEIVNATFAVGAAGSNVTTENVLVGWADVLVNPYLASQPGTWYLADVSRGIMPFVNQVRTAYEFAALDRLTDENVFKLNQFLYGGYYRGNVGVTLPFLISKNTPTP